MLLRQGINLVQTPAWQRRGTLAYREHCQKQAENHMITLLRTKEDWNIPLLSSSQDLDLIRSFLEWTKRWEGTENV